MTHKQIKQLNISKTINIFSIFFVNNNQDKFRSESLIPSLIEFSIEKIIYDYFIDSQLKNMTLFVENIVIQAIVNIAINQNLKNIMNKI